MAALGPSEETVGVADELMVAAGLLAMESEPAAPADGSIGGPSAAGVTAALGPSEETVAVVEELTVVESLLAIERQPASPATTRNASVAREATIRWRRTGRRFSGSLGVPTSTK